MHEAHGSQDALGELSFEVGRVDVVLTHTEGLEEGGQLLQGEGGRGGGGEVGRGGGGGGRGGGEGRGEGGGGRGEGGDCFVYSESKK